MLTVRCKVCANQANKDLYANNATYREAQNAASLAYHKDKYANDPEFREAQKARSSACRNTRYANDDTYREAEKARSLAYQNARYANDDTYREAQNARCLAYAKENPGKVNAKSAKRRALKIQATPPWAELQEINKLYEDCPPGYHVDHIVPLNGRKVSGLHVLGNLQYLPASENLSKSNKHEI